MTLTYHQMLPILYQPVIYTHASHLPDGWLPGGVASDSLINFWLSTHYQLTPMHTLPVGLTPLQQLLLKNWAKIPQLAELTGAYLLRHSICSGRKLHLLTSHQRQFISLPMRMPSMMLQGGDLHPGNVGAALVRAQISGLPAALNQRLRLMFPQNWTLPSLESEIVMNANNLTRMGLNYAITSQH